MSPSMVSPEEYASLPLSIQRKYFSSVERLRIAQEAAVQSQEKAAAAMMDDSCGKKMKKKKKKQKKKTVAAPWSRSDVDVDEHQALRFLALSSKAKRTHFTQEELILLSQSSERVLGWAALHAACDYDDAYVDSTSSENVPSESLGSTTCFSEDSHGYIPEMDKDCFEAKTESLHSIEHVDVGEVTSVHNHNRQTSIASTVDSSSPPHSQVLTIQQPASRYHNRSTKRRRSIFVPLPLPPPVLSPIVPPSPQPVLLPPVPPLPSPNHITTTLDPTTDIKQHKDTDARSKLRELLTSPDKFDEALEFGFPERRRPRRRRTSAISSSVGASSLPSELDDLSISHTRDDDDDDDDDDEDDYLSGPQTPSILSDPYNPSIILHHRSTSSTSSSNVALCSGLVKSSSLRSLSPTDHLESSTAGENRSMTFKTTLTRSDLLKAPEEKLYSLARLQASGVDLIADSGHHGDDDDDDDDDEDDHHHHHDEKATVEDPLRLETLKVCDDHSGRQGVFAVAAAAKEGGRGGGFGGDSAGAGTGGTGAGSGGIFHGRGGLRRVWKGLTGS